jgi:hypothetical protein
MTVSTQEQILNALSKASANNPVALDDLINQLKIDAVKLNPILDSMVYNLPATINRCNVIRDNINKIMYWPTGIILKGNFSRFQINPPIQKTMPKLTAPRRSELIQNQLKEKAVPTTSSKSIAEQMREYISKHPGCTMRQMSAYLEKADLGQSFIKHDVDSGNIVTSTNDDGKKTYYMKDDFKQSEAAIDFPAPTDNWGTVVNFVIDTKSDVGKNPDSDINPKLNSKFKVAYTSEKCLEIYDSEKGNITLTTEQTKVLFNYLREMNLVGTFVLSN